MMNRSLVRVTVFAFCGGIVALIMHSCTSSPDKPRSAGSKRVFDYNLKNALTKNPYPVVILGGGPAGLAAAIYTAPQYEAVVIAGGPRPSALTGSHAVENWAGSPVEPGEKILERTKKQAELRGAQFIEQGVSTLDLAQWPFAITLDDGQVVYALSLIYALGAYPRLLDIPGEKEFWGQGVSSCARCDAMFYKKKVVAVVGGRDSAIEEATELVRFAIRVIILYRGDQLRASAAMQKHLREDYPQIEVKYNVQPKEILGDENGVNGVRLVDTKTGKESVMPIDGLFLAIGHEPNTALIKDFVACDDQGYIVLSDRSQATNVTGVFAAGDVADRDYRQAITSAGDGAKAGMDANKFLESIGVTFALDQEIRKNRKPIAAGLK